VKATDGSERNAKIDESRAKGWINAAQGLLDQAHALAASA
jgi:hypothetical protein